MSSIDRCIKRILISYITERDRLIAAKKLVKEKRTSTTFLNVFEKCMLDGGFNFD